MKISKKTLTSNLLSLAIAFLIVSIPWEIIRDYDFNDLKVNILKYENIDIYFNTDLHIFNIKSFVSDEPLWYLINLFFSKLGWSGEFLFGFMAFLSFFIILKYVYIKTNNLWYFVFLVHPVFLDFVLSQQRNALVFSIFLFFFNSGKFKYLILPIMPLIHSFSPFLIVISLFSDFYNRKKKFIVNFSLIIFSFLVSVFLVYGRSLFSGFTEDTRFQDYITPVNSGLYTLPWALYLIWIIFFSKKINLNYIVLCVFLSMYIFLTHMEFYAIRFLAMAIPLLIANLSNLNYRKHFCIIFILHQCILMYLWINVGFRI